MTDPSRSADWVEIRAAMRRIVEAMSALPTEVVALSQAHARTLGQDVISPLEHPPWDNSAMDGFAARTDDVRGASAETPIRLRVLEHIPAGGFPTQTITERTAARIMTGAPLPAGADCVIRVEHTQEEDDGTVLVFNDFDAGRNVRARAEDLKRGDVVVQGGRYLRAAEIGALATVGTAVVPVTRKPTVAILSTGDELADVSEYNDIVAGRKIANSNSYALAASVEQVGAVPLVLGIARDDETDLRQHLAQCAGADLLITTAGASVGDHDLVKDVLDSMGFELEFWRVRMRPGSPFSFGWLPIGERRIPVFGLPGNPVSALVTFELFVKPALRRMLGRSAVFSPTLHVRCASRIPSKAGLTHFLRVTLTTAADGVAEAELTGAQGSGLVTSMAAAHALLIVPEDRDGFEAGEMAWAVRLDGADATQPDIGF